MFFSFQFSFLIVYVRVMEEYNLQKKQNNCKYAFMLLIDKTYLEKSSKYNKMIWNFNIQYFCGNEAFYKAHFVGFCSRNE